MTLLINEEFYLVRMSIIFFWKWILRASLIIRWFCFHYHLEIEAWDGSGDYNDLRGEMICWNYGRFYNFMVYRIKKYITSLDLSVLYVSIGCWETLCIYLMISLYYILLTWMTCLLSLLMKKREYNTLYYKFLQGLGYNGKYVGRKKLLIKNFPRIIHNFI